MTASHAADAATDSDATSEAAPVTDTAAAIAAAKENFAKGNLIPTKEDYRGAVRIRQKTVAEIEKEREKRVITAQ